MIKNKGWFIGAVFLIIFLTFFLRFWQLGTVPAGMHQDEAWFAYNAMLMQKFGENIYGEKWSLTVDMWGDHVSSFHPYILSFFLNFLPANTANFRLPFAIASIMTSILAGWLLWRWTKNQFLILIFMLLFAFSPWNIVMTRASSSVIFDSLVTLIVLVVIFEGLRFFSLNHQWKKKSRLMIFFLMSTWWLIGYGLMILNYFTYFTSRLTMPLLVIGVVIIARSLFIIPKKALVTTFLMLLAYGIFPFLILLSTPFAQGRYEETTILSSELVKSNTYLDITRSGQSGMPVFMTRLFFNQITENGRVLLQQILEFTNPQVLLFQLNKPIRYQVPNVGPITLAEYLGFIVALMVAVLFINQDKIKYRLIGGVLFLMTGVSLIPTFLTIDDFPNFQRGVFATPYWQMASAVGLTQLYWLLRTNLKMKWYAKSEWLSLGFLSLIVASIIFSFSHFLVFYFGHLNFANVHNRSRAGEKLGEWINTNAPQASLVMDHDEANFLYAYLYAGENVREIGIESSEKYLLKAKEFRIGNRFYLNRFCEKDNVEEFLRQNKIEYILMKRFPHKDTCNPPPQYQILDQVFYDDGMLGYDIYKIMPEFQDRWFDLSIDLKEFYPEMQ